MDRNRALTGSDRTHNLGITSGSSGWVSGSFFSPGCFVRVAGAATVPPPAWTRQVVEKPVLTSNLQLSTSKTIEFGPIPESWELEIGNWVLSDGFLHHPA
jgi:hypothetical protein